MPNDPKHKSHDLTDGPGRAPARAMLKAVGFTDDDLATMNMVRCSFDPEMLFNPGKVFPTPRLCGDKPGIYKPHAAELSGQAERV